MRSFSKTVLLTTLFVGTTDLIAAYLSQYVRTGKFADKMLHYIAGGALGLERSMGGGYWVGLLGLLFHYFIALSFTLLFFIAFRHLKLLSVNKYLVGLLYGIFVGAFMSFVVLPLTALPSSPFRLQEAIVGWGILAVALGVPISISANNFYRRQGSLSGSSK
jgi:hypothetical protein